MHKYRRLKSRKRQLRGGSSLSMSKLTSKISTLLRGKNAKVKQIAESERQARFDSNITKLEFNRKIKEYTKTLKVEPKIAKELKRTLLFKCDIHFALNRLRANYLTILLLSDTMGTITISGNNNMEIVEQLVPSSFIDANTKLMKQFYDSLNHTDLNKHVDIFHNYIGIDNFKLLLNSKKKKSILLESKRLNREYETLNNKLIQKLLNRIKGTESSNLGNKELMNGLILNDASPNKDQIKQHFEAMILERTLPSVPDIDPSILSRVRDLQKFVRTELPDIGSVSGVKKQRKSSKKRRSRKKVKLV